jgi:hypothetical protein
MTIRSWHALMLLTLLTLGARGGRLAAAELLPAAADAPPEESLLATAEDERRLVTGMVKADIENELKHARSGMATDPAGVSRQLKMSLARLQNVVEFNAGERAQLRRQVEQAIRESDRQAIVKESRDLEREQTRATAEERLRIVNSLDRQEEKVKQLMDRFNSLMSEGRYLLAEEAAADEVAETLPNSTIAVSSALDSRMVRYSQADLHTRVARQKGVVDSLAQVELALVPFVDDQPIVYPDAAIWEELTQRRKKWKDFASADMKDRSGATARIQKALGEPTNLEFVEAPLQDVIDYLKDLHGIEIQIDNKALEDASIGADTPVTRNLKGITLKSALRLMLGTMDLTYVIKNEVLLITTPEKAGNELVTKVYPVADLVLPIRQTGMMGGFGGMGGMGGGMGGMGGGGMGGGMGGMGGGMGGMGGGMGGMGGGGMGGMGGGGMGGGGGGFFNVLSKPDASH